MNTARFKRRSDVLTAVEADHQILMDAAGKRFYGLDEVGIRIWELLEAPSNVAELTTRLQSEYEAAAETLTQDITDFLLALRDRDLIEEVRA